MAASGASGREALAPCPRCQGANPVNARFCGTCGARLELACPACQAGNPGGNRFCHECGAALGEASAPARSPGRQPYTPAHLAERILTSRAALEGEHKQVTVLFCDIANSTRLAEQVGPEPMHDLLNSFFDVALREIHQYEGTVNQFLGDGFMALFGAPIAHEDHAQRAALAALGLHRALAGDGDHAPALPKSIALRMGLHTGPVVVGAIGDDLRMDYTAVGDTTNLAARLQQSANPGTILVSDATRNQLGGDIEVEALPPIMIKGKPEPMAVYRLLGVNPRAATVEAQQERALTPFIGREHELAALGNVVAQVEEGRGQVVGIVGDPGVGKSRLLFEFRQELAGRSVTVREGRCLSYATAVPYHPILELLRADCEISEADDAATVADRVRRRVEAVGLDPAETALYLLHLLGVEPASAEVGALTPEALQGRCFEALQQMILKDSVTRPLILIVEDLHWIDSTSEEYLAKLVESAAGAQLLLLTTYRPGYRSPWLEKSYFTQIALPSLSPELSEALLRGLPGPPLPDSLIAEIKARGEGNAFLLEELGEAARQRGWSPGDPLPEAIESMLMAWIDRLPDDQKRVLQTASVLGREFPLRVLDALWDGPGGVASHVLELKRYELLHERAGSEHPTYVFRHGLTREVAYRSLLTPARRLLHAAAAGAIQRVYADQIDEMREAVARHLAHAADAEAGTASGQAPGDRAQSPPSPRTM
jgi:class 3 adenylate cyclase